MSNPCLAALVRLGAAATMTSAPTLRATGSAVLATRAFATLGRSVAAAPSSSTPTLVALAVRPTAVGRLLPRDNPAQAIDVGSFVFHKSSGVRAVIVRSDPQCKRRELWCQLNGIDRLTHGRNQPFYLALPDARDCSPQELSFIYVPHESVIPFASNTPIQHPLAPFVIKSFDSVLGRCIPCDGELPRDYED
ncbi:hypothetical protein CAOG_03686 [Capsaspora owczarzaki ATCC 30864]|uniref:Hemimethylated DNA-binding domain-containing protein n=1 Tax=Capsaspora owczarzaki (strain ATCC 30864) TaxID=595528 RepID=A0A0D2VQ97_CAPO3|nr:hypothetical protein CAOG_03686 [Capsaspora owczarzaki ATCC 30864]KJE92787.1 hypothetical protein CAOG_003686 [Capsaspora owczarzaki ATCC 30864]|eukprot:XP_004363414.2 hypothetical protein CAOG_03686 [Capsaspora owczarzaki ATCC 30864]